MKPKEGQRNLQSCGKNTAARGTRQRSPKPPEAFRCAGISKPKKTDIFSSAEFVSAWDLFQE